jgi:hypothetical protein
MDHDHQRLARFVLEAFKIGGAGAGWIALAFILVSILARG